MSTVYSERYYSKLIAPMSRYSSLLREVRSSKINFFNKPSRNTLGAYLCSALTSTAYRSPDVCVGHLQNMIGLSTYSRVVLGYEY